MGPINQQFGHGEPWDTTSRSLTADIYILLCLVTFKGQYIYRVHFILTSNGRLSPVVPFCCKYVNIRIFDIGVSRQCVVKDAKVT